MLYIYIPFAHFFHPLFFCKNFVPKFITRAKNISRTTAAAVAVVQFIRVLRSCVFACVCVCVCVWEKIARRVRRWATVNARNNPAGIRDTARGISKVEGVNEKKKKQQSNENNIMTVALIPHIAFQTSAGTCVLVRRGFTPVRSPSLTVPDHQFTSYDRIMYTTTTLITLSCPGGTSLKPNRTCAILSRFPTNPIPNNIV